MSISVFKNNTLVFVDIFRSSHGGATQSAGSQLEGIGGIRGFNLSKSDNAFLILDLFIFVADDFVVCCDIKNVFHSSSTEGSDCCMDIF
jgi:hypothetical protein